MAIAGQRLVIPNQFQVTSLGSPYVGARLFFYLSGTSTPLDTYSDVDLTIPNLNPVVAGGDGYFGDIWLSPTQAYKVQLYTPATDSDPVGSEIWSMDPVGPAAGGTQSNTAGIVGEVRAFAGPDDQIPSGWLLCYGQAVSRTTYASLFTVLGTVWGAGDSSTTFNVPDLRGRSMFGKDNMGGVAASRLTAGVSGVTGSSLGAVGGDQRVPSHTHPVSDPGHLHAITDPGHAHHAGVDTPVAGPGGLGVRSNTFGPTDVSTTSSVTAITINTATTGITTTAPASSGSSANVPPAAVVNWIVYGGV